MNEYLSHKKLWLTLLLLSFAGMLVTTYLIYQHYKDPGSSFCNVSDYVSCDVVNKSIYSEIFGIPVAIFGFLAYAAIFILALGVQKGWRVRPIISFATLFTGIGLLFSLYLTYIEFFVLQALCVFCLTQQILILTIFLIFLTLWLKDLKSWRQS